MSQENVKVVCQFFEALAKREEDAMQRLAHEDLVYVEDPKWPGADTYRGQTAVSDCWAKYDDLLGEAVTMVVEEVRDVGDRVIALVRVAGRTRGVDVPYDHT